jgi:hypothetical protein
LRNDRATILAAVSSNGHAIRYAPKFWADREIMAKVVESSPAAIAIAAPSSGQGKTTVVSALARLHARQGRKVRVFKCGPDFLDPYWHALASGQPVYQLDLWMTGADDCRSRLAQAASEADLIIVEGVMGLFDGEPSAADLAERNGDASGGAARFILDRGIARVRARRGRRDGRGARAGK